MKHILLCCYLFTCCIPMVTAQTLLPAPRSVRQTAGTFILDSSTTLLYTSVAEQRTAALFHNYLKERYSLDLPLQQSTGKDTCRAVVFSGTETTNTPEAYHISITSGKLTVTGNGAGLFYGLQTLIQLLSGEEQLPKAGPHPLPCQEIEDAPAYPYRGIMLDVGLHFFPVSFIRQCIDLMAQYKLNIFHWHLTEDQGWRVEIKKYPQLTSIGSIRAQTIISNPDKQFDGFDHTPHGGSYSQAEIREVVQYAADRYITIVPEIEMPGHCRSALTAYPYLACGEHPGPFTVAQTWGIFDDVYCPGKESTFNFLEDVLSEVMDLFPGKYIHIGGDECPKTKWKQCPYCQQRIRDLHLKDENELQSYFIQRIEKYINAKGKQIIGWDEILEGGLAPNATVMSWRGTAGGVAAVRLGHDVIMAPNTALYFDYGQGDPAQEPRTDEGSNPLSKVYSYDPIAEGLTQEQKGHIKGVEACLWTEHIATPAKAEYMLMPRMLALAEIAWTPASRKDKDSFLKDRLPVLLGRIDRSGMLYRVPEPIGAADTTLYGQEFRIPLQPSVAGAKIFYTLDGYTPPRDRCSL